MEPSSAFLPGRSPGQDHCHLVGALRGSHMIPVTAATSSSPEGQGTATEAEGSWDIPKKL